MNTKKAFSLSELIVALVIVGTISILLVPNLFDTSSTKLNEAAAQKAEYDIRQAVLRAQAECPRFRCGNQKSLILQYLPNSSDIVTYYVAEDVDVNGDVNGAKVIVDIDSDNASNLAFNVNNRGNVTDVDNCSVKDYKDGNTCGENIDDTYEKKD